MRPQVFNIYLSYLEDKITEVRQGITKAVKRKGRHQIWLILYVVYIVLLATSKEVRY